jgi:peptidoglycan/xylan/chitin deacetylase (PgdA/CDA1 family)
MIALEEISYVMLFRPFVILYHAVSDTWDDVLSLHVRDVEAQLKRLVDRGFRGCTGEELVRRPTDGRLVHVTFDDGYASIANALPILRSLGIPSTIFVCTDFAQGGRPLLIPELAAVAQVDELKTIDWAQLRELAADGLVEIGSHTRSHAHLPGLSDDELTREIRDAKQAIEDNLGRRCPSFAYPYGEHDQRVRDAVRAAGHTLGFAASRVPYPFDPYQIPRTGFWRGGAGTRNDLKTRLPVRLLRGTGWLDRPRFASGRTDNRRR